MIATRRSATQIWGHTGAVMLLALGLAGCGLPRGAALQSEILRGTQSAESDIQVLAVTREALADLDTWPVAHPELRHSWPTTGASPAARMIRAGDVLTISVWDSQPDSLLTTGEQRVVNMQEVPVGATGRVFVPYVGEVRVSGLTAEQARREIQAQLRSIVPDGQVQLNVAGGAANTIDVVTGVVRPGRVPLPEISPTILSVLAESGGIAPSLRNPLVRLNRAGQAYAIPARELFAVPAHDIQLRGGDRIMVEEDHRSFVALGASGTQRVVYFEREEITALDALSTIGGLAETRANLQGVMVLREYPTALVRDTGPAPRHEQVVFTFDLASADGLFAAQRFGLQPNDVVLVSESVAPLITQGLLLARRASQLSNTLFN